MNILQILWKLGYDVLSFNEEGEYRVQLGHERELREGYSQEQSTIRVKEVGFNGFGNLYVTFTEADIDNCFDSYEFKNMDPKELY